MAKKTRPGKLNMSEMRKLMNKRAGQTVAHDLRKENPTSVKEWIPTGSRWLDSIICRGKLAGIPVGKITEIAGLPSTGKSYMAAHIAANAQKMGMDVIYFDSESAIDPDFLQKVGVDLDRFGYVQATTVEYVLSSIEDLMDSGNKLLFIWDSLAHTPNDKDVESNFDPQSSIALKARVLAYGMQKLTVPLANTQCTFLVLNQLKTNIGHGPNARIQAMINPYTTPGGKAMNYSASLRIWLTKREAKAGQVIDEKDTRIGNEIKATIKKSRFGTENRNCNFKIIWAGTDVVILDEESWLDAIKSSHALTNAGAWYNLKSSSGQEFKFQAKNWVEKLKEPEFRQLVFNIMDEEVIMKFNSDGEGEA